MSRRKDHKQFLDELATMLTAMVPHVERVLSEGFTSEERWDFRRRFPEERDIFHLSNLLHSLCSESARRLLLEEERQRWLLHQHQQRLKGRPPEEGWSESRSASHSVTHSVSITSTEGTLP